MLLTSLLLAGCSTGRDPEPLGRDAANSPGQGEAAPVTLQLNWFPEAEHGGYYAALVHGYFLEQGLQVEIRPGGPSVPVLTQIASNRVEFGLANADQLLLAWAQEARTVAVLAPLQESPRCIMVHAAAGIRQLEELRDVTLAMNVSSTFSLFLQKQLPLPGVRIVPYSGSVAMFLLEPRFAQQAYVFSEPFAARKQGADPRCLMVSELGFNPYTSLLVTSPDTVRDDPELVRRMVAACARGWLAYLEHPEPTNRYLARLNREMDGEILAYGAEQLRPLCHPAEPQTAFGSMSEERWRTLAGQLAEVGALPAGRIDPSACYTNRFLPPAAESPAE